MTFNSDESHEKGTEHSGSGLFSKRKSSSGSLKKIDSKSESIPTSHSFTPRKTGDDKVTKSSITIKSKGIRGGPGATARFILQILAGLLVVFAIVYFLFVHILKKPIPLITKSRTTYTVSALSNSQKVIQDMKKIIKDSGLAFSVNKTTRYNKKKTGFQVIQKFNDMEAAKSNSEFLRKKKIPAKVKEDPDDGIYIMVWGVFPDKKTANKHCDKATKVMKTKFVVEHYYKRIPYFINEIQVTDISSERIAKKLKEQLSACKPFEINITTKEKND